MSKFVHATLNCFKIYVSHKIDYSVANWMIPSKNDLPSTYEVYVQIDLLWGDYISGFFIF